MAGKSGFLRALLALAGALLFLAAPAFAQSRAYLPLIDEDEVEVMDLSTNTSLGTIPVGAFPSGVSVSPNGQRAYITNGMDGTLSVIDTTAAPIGAVMATITIGGCCSAPLGVVVSPNNALVFVANFAEDEVAVVDAGTNLVITDIPVGAFPAGIAISPDGTRVFVANQADDTVSVINTASLTVIATIPVGAAPFGVAFSPDGARAYVSNQNDFSVTAIDTGSNTVAGTVTVTGAMLQGVVVSLDGLRAYVTAQFDDEVNVIDTVSLTQIDTIPVGGAPTGLSIDSVSGLLYVANTGSQDVSWVDLTTNTELGFEPLAGEPFSLGNFITNAPPPAVVPTLSEWAMIALGLMLAAGGILRLRRRPAVA